MAKPKNKVEPVQSELKNGVPAFYPKSASEWRNWLKQNHLNQENVWLIFYKKGSGYPTVTYSEAVDEALCFGWIDSKPNKRDEHSYYRYFSKRQPGSNWSKVNKAKIAQLTAAAKMHPSGIAMVELAKKSGTWDALNEVEELIIPADLASALQQNTAAATHFHAFPPSSRKLILDWIQSAKREETRVKRIRETVELAARNIRANHYRAS